MNDCLNLKNYAHIGDAVWEIFVRKYVIYKTSNSKIMHKMTTDRVNAHFQKSMLDFLYSYLTDEEIELVRRARNLSIPVARKSIQADYRMATAFEVLCGYWYINDQDRLNKIFSILSSVDDFR